MSLQLLAQLKPVNFYLNPVNYLLKTPLTKYWEKVYHFKVLQYLQDHLSDQF